MKTTPLLAGSVWGGSYAFVYLVTYIAAAKTVDGLGWLLFAIGLAVMIYFGLKKRKENEGYLSFGNAFGFLSLTAVIGLLISTGFTMLLYYVIDPGYMEAMKEIAIEQAIEQSEASGASDDQIDMGLKFIEFLFSAVGQLVIVGLWLLFWVFVGLIVSLVIKKNRPEFA